MTTKSKKSTKTVDDKATKLAIIYTSGGGSSYVIDLETEKVVHFSFCREPLEANKNNLQPKLHDWASGYSWTYTEKDGTVRRG